MKKSITKSLLLTTLLTSSVVWGGAPAFAEESLNEYSIDEIVVTQQEQKNVMLMYRQRQKLLPVKD